MLEKEGLYEQLINRLVASKLQLLDTNEFYIKEIQIDKTEASRILANYLTEVIQYALANITGDDSIEAQINLSNKIILLLKDQLQDEEFREDLVDTNSKILKAIFKKLNSNKFEKKYILGSVWNKKFVKFFFIITSSRTLIFFLNNKIESNNKLNNNNILNVTELRVIIDLPRISKWLKKLVKIL